MQSQNILTKNQDKEILQRDMILTSNGSKNAKKKSQIAGTDFSKLESLDVLLN